MLCAVDVGNTQTVIGFFEQNSWSKVFRVDSDDAHNLEWLDHTINIYFQRVERELARTIKTVVVGSVVPEITHNLKHVLSQHSQTKLLVVDSSLTLGIPIALENPREVGADRIANAYAALVRYGPGTIVVDFGTATNMDVVGHDGSYLGGVISPGLETSVKALFSHAAKLKELELEVATRAIGRNTKEALESGFYFGEAAKVEGLVARIEDEIGFRCTRVTTGGLCEVLTPLLSGDYHIDPNLTLEGLRLIAELN